MADLIAGRVRPGAMAFVLLTVALSWSIWIVTWFAMGRPATTTASAGMVAAVYAGSFAPGVAAAILSAMSRPGALKTWLCGFIRFRCGWRAYAAAAVPPGVAPADVRPRLCAAARRAARPTACSPLPDGIPHFDFQRSGDRDHGRRSLGGRRRGAAISCPGYWTVAARRAPRSSSASSGRCGICRSWRCSPTGEVAFPSRPISRSTRSGSSVCRSSCRGCG